MDSGPMQTRRLVATLRHYSEAGGVFGATYPDKLAAALLELAGRHERRVFALIEANNREVARRRAITAERDEAKRIIESLLKDRV